MAAEFCDRERVHAMEVVAALEGITSTPYQVEARTAGDQNTLTGFSAVPHALQIVPPALELVDLVEDPELRCGQLSRQDPRAIARDIPVQVTLDSAGKLLRECGLPDLPRAGHENHLSFEIRANRLELGAAVVSRSCRFGGHHPTLSNTDVFTSTQKRPRTFLTMGENVRAGCLRARRDRRAAPSRIRASGRGDRDRSPGSR